MAPVIVERLKTRRDFLRVAGKRRKWVTPGLILQAAPMPEQDRVPPAPASADGGDETKPTPPSRARVGFTVSKKVGNAVARNRARRRLKAAAADLMPELATADTDYVIIGRGMTLDRPWDDLKRDLRIALSRVLDAPIDTGGRPPRKGKGGQGPRNQGKGGKPPSRRRGRGEDGDTGQPRAEQADGQ